MNILEQAILQVRRAARPHEARWRSLVAYLVVLLIALALLTMVRAMIYGLHGYGESLLDKLSAGVLTAGVAVFLVFLLSPRMSFEENLTVLDSWQIRPKLNDALRDTRSYYFRGRSGRWMRSEAMPKLSAQATRESLLRSLHLILPNPDNATTLKTYADYRNSLPKADEDPWTPERIRAEIFATLLEAGRLASASNFFEAHVALLTDFSLFRADLSDSGLVLTREDVRLPGWFSSSGTKFYASYLEDLRMAERRGRNIPFAEYTYPAKFTSSDVNTALAALGFTTTLSAVDCKGVIKAMSNRSNPYA